MGYDTDFIGQFELDRPLSQPHADYLIKFSKTRRMQRDPAKLEDISDPIREAVGLPLGVEGEYFVGSLGFMGQDRDKSILAYNDPPRTQPGLWCKWVPSNDLKAIEWNGVEKFSYYVEWLQYLIDNFLSPWGYIVNGKVKWVGEDPEDLGLIRVKDNVISINKALITYS